MKVLVANSELDFLTGGFDGLSSQFPIVVVSAALRKCTVLKAIPTHKDLRRWKSLDYKSIDGDRGTVRVIDDWRMDLRHENTNEEECSVAVTGLRINDEN